MSLKTLISVIIPTYNRAYVLFRATNSVLAQKGIAFELIVVDDGSTDETRALVQKFESEQIRYFYQDNQGPSSARNLGIQKSNGPYIAFLDSDDEWLPNKLKTQLSFLDQNPDMLVCQTEEIWIRNGKRVNPMKKHKKHGGYIFEYCLPLCIVSPSAVMMRKTFFDQIGLFDESLPACEDYDLWLRASARMNFGLIEKSLVVKYGGHSDQTSRKYEKMDQFRVRALVKLIESGNLNFDQKEKAILELINKCQILSAGAQKRGNLDDFEHFNAIVSQFSNFNKIN